MLNTHWHWHQAHWHFPRLIASYQIEVDDPVQAYCVTFNEVDDSTQNPINPIFWTAHSEMPLQLVRVNTETDARDQAKIITPSARLSFSEPISCRYLRVYHRSTTGQRYIVREFYPYHAA